MNYPIDGIYKPASVELEPGTEVSRWSVREVKLQGEDTPTHHIVAFNNRTYDGRVSSKVVSFDQKTMTCETNSGRRYTLVGDPGYSSDAEYVWGRWIHINGVNLEEVVDVTEKYLPT